MSSAVQKQTSTNSPKITKRSKKVEKTKITSSHPPTSVMVNNAIKTLKERGGSSFQAIKKYISNTYKIDAEKAAPYIKKYLKNAADKGKLTRTKGKGASGSFKLVSASPAGAEGRNTSAKKSRSVVKLKKPKASKKAKSTAKPKSPKNSKKKITKAATSKKRQTPKPKKNAKK